MNRITVFIMLLLCSGCASLPNEYPQASPQQDKAVIFDIDGTLTPTPLRFWQARDAAPEALRAFESKGRTIIYISARTLLLQWHIPGWLEENGFPTGYLFVTQNTEDRSDPAEFKQRVLQELAAHGWQLELAYGDSSSDFAAYGAAGMDQDQVFALLRKGDEDCKPGVWRECLPSWQSHWEFILQLEKASPSGEANINKQHNE